MGFVYRSQLRREKRSDTSPPSAGTLDSPLGHLCARSVVVRKISTPDRNASPNGREDDPAILGDGQVRGKILYEGVESSLEHLLQPETTELPMSRSESLALEAKASFMSGRRRPNGS